MHTYSFSKYSKEPTHSPISKKDVLYGVSCILQQHVRKRMKKQLELVAKSYDKGIDLGKKGIDSYSNFPSYITSHPNYPLFEQMRTNETLSDTTV